MTTPSMPSLWRSLARYAPAVAALVAIALWVAAVPSTQPKRGKDDFDLFATTDGATAAAGAGGRQAPAGGTASSGASGSATSAGSAVSGSRGAGGAAAGAGSGVAAPAADCSRNGLTGGTTCRPPAFTGDNGGATYRGVTADTIKLVFYQVKQNEQVQAILSAAGTATNEQREASFKAIVKWVNENYELYGRKIEPIFWVGTTPANDPAAQQADAVYVAEELDAFAVITLYPNPIFHEELHRRGVVSFTWNQFPQAFFEQVSPHLFGLFPDRDLVVAHQAEYWCKRLRGGNAEHSGSPTYQVSPRVYGIIYQDGTDNGPALADLVKRQCGIEIASMLSYPADIGNAAAISTNIVTQMQQAGVTTVTCLCDVIAPVFFTAQATKQGWFPEWIHNGFFVTDANAAGRLYDPTQWSHSFGPSSLAYPLMTAENAGYRVCMAGGADKTACVKAQANSYAFVALLATALEQLGPRVDDLSLARQLVSLPPLVGEAPNRPTYSFGRQGPGPYTFVDDFMEIWYDATRTGNDGERGTAFYVDSGVRHTLGGWSATPPKVFVDDGSEQPPRDPDL
jgi:hypothetical protein